MKKYEPKQEENLPTNRKDDLTRLSQDEPTDQDELTDEELEETNGGTGKVRLSDINFIHYIDKATP
jgi:type VI protein secretion system component Hcp